MRRTKIDLGFWTRIALTSVVVNVPLALSMVLYGMQPLFAFGFSALAGVATLALWDGARANADEASQDARQLEVPRTVYVTSSLPATLRALDQTEDVEPARVA